MNRTGLRLLLLSVTLLSGCGLLPREESPQAPILPEPPSVSASITYPVERLDLYEEIEGTAVVSPMRQTELYFARSGRLATLAVRPQQAVKAGAVLAAQDTRDLLFDLEVAGIDLEIARIRLEMAQYATLGKLEADIKGLEIKKQEATVAHLQDLVERATIRAPYDGVVSAVNYEVGDAVEEYAAVMEIVDPGNLELVMRVSMDEYGRVAPGQKCFIEVQRDVWRAGSVLRTASRTVTSEAGVRRDEYLLHLALSLPVRLEMSSRLSTRIIEKERPQTLSIPLAALREYQDRRYVRVQEGEVRREVDVRVGIQTETKAEILEGLEEGDLVIGR